MIEILKHLIITEAVEIGIAFLLGVKGKKNIINIFVINMITNVPLNFILIFIISNQVLYLSGYTGINIFIWYYIIVAVLEFFILFLEAIFYFKKIIFTEKCVFYKKKDRFYSYILMSLILNVSSIVAGIIFG